MRVALFFCVAAAMAVAASASRGTYPRTNEMVLTPVGMWPADCVHHAGNGNHITEDPVTGEIVIRASDDVNSAELFRRERCDREVVAALVNEAAVKGNDMSGGGVDANGWQAYTKVKTKTDAGFTRFNCQWTVPGKPRESAQTLFSFNGLQNIDWVPPQPRPSQSFDIIQPVLQYGYSAAGGFPESWSMASWYVTLGSDVVYSTLTPVETGPIIGLMNTTSTSEGSWFTATADKSTGKATSFTISRTLLDVQPWAYVTLEEYDVEDCYQETPLGSEYVFTDMVIDDGYQTVDVDWEVGKDGQNPPACGAAVKAGFTSAAVTLQACTSDECSSS